MKTVLGCILNFFILINRVWSKVSRIASNNAALNKGLTLGKGTLLVGKQSFGTEPYLISVGANCLITHGVRFITHDGSIQVPLIKSGEYIQDVYSNKSTFSPIKIGDNVFIGTGSIILPGTILGSDSIVAAGAVVKGEFPQGAVIGGNPSKVICSVEEYFERNKYNILLFSSKGSKMDQIINHVKERGFSW